MRSPSHLTNRFLGILVTVAFLSVMNLLNFFKPKQPASSIDSYGQPMSGIEQQQIQLIMEWLFTSLMAAGYFGKSHLIWYDSDNLDPSLEQVVKASTRHNELIFLYRIGGRAMTPPDGYYWRMMDEHPSMRVYQLEVKNVR